MDQFIKELDISGAYFDLGQVFSCDNPLHGCGWTDDAGKKHRTFSVLGTREINKRIYIAIKNHDPDAVVINHMSGEITMPAHGFADILIDGENIAGPLASQENYYKILPFDKFQGEFMSRQWGPAVLFLPQFTRSTSMHRPKRLPFWRTLEADKPKDHLIGICLVHDGFLWPMNGISLDSVWDVQDAFGWDDKVEFLPYWKNQKYVSILAPKSSDIVVSAFRRLGKYLFVPFNNTDKDIDLQLQIDRTACSLPQGKTLKVIDSISGESFDLVDNKVTLPLKARAFRMIEVKP